MLATASRRLSTSLIAPLIIRQMSSSINVHAHSIAAVARASQTSSGEYFADYAFPTQKLAQVDAKGQKQGVVLIACGSYSPVTNLHLRMFEMARDYINDTPHLQLLGGYFSPVSDAYNKPGLVPWQHRVAMLEAGCASSDWIMVDSWESRQKEFQRTAWVLDHFDKMVNGDGKAETRGARVRVMLLAGSDLIQSFTVPDLWRDEDLNHIVGDYGCVIIERINSDVQAMLLDHDILHRHRHNVHLVKQHVTNDISSTKIRLFIKRGLSTKYLMPDRVIDYIAKHGLYRGAASSKTN
ncbi:hypothetical protein HDU90_006136 [Geranomyces variabilis]|nr:hypothetical protein HDU90_006136 [Geranomyces variabilis]